MKKDRKKTDRVMIFAVIALCLFSSFTVDAEFELGRFWSKNDNTLVLTNSSNNVNIGENKTTTYKLNVNGTSCFNDAVNILNHAVIGDSLNFTSTMNQIKIISLMGTTNIDFPTTFMESTTITFPYGTYDVVSTSGTQTIAGQKTFNAWSTYFSNYLRHAGNSNTYISFLTDKISVECGGANLMTLQERSSFPNIIAFNADGQAVEFRIATDTKPYAVYITDDKDIETTVDINSYENLSCTNGFYPPDVRTGADLTMYENMGSLIINTTTNLIGTYDGSVWYWR